ncbi:MAG: MFS transporter [Bacillota bacterium]|nr:MFS transporter [Bacillota bacterium]
MASLCYLIAYGMIMADQVYLYTYELGFDGNGISLAMVTRSLIIIAFIPVINRIVKQTDKRKALLAGIAFGIIGLCAMRFADISRVEMLALFIFFAAVTTQIYWQIMPAIFYDLCEYDEFETGNRREGAIVSVQGLVEAFAVGIGSQILGIILQLAGFDGSAQVQSQQALEWVFNCITWIPAIFLFIAGVAVYKYPITKEVYEDIMRKLKGDNNVRS